MLCACFLADDNAGSSMAARIAMMAMTTSSSTSVKARRGFMRDTTPRMGESFKFLMNWSAEALAPGARRQTGAGRRRRAWFGAASRTDRYVRFKKRRRAAALQDAGAKATAPACRLKRVSGTGVGKVKNQPIHEWIWP